MNIDCTENIYICIFIHIKCTIHFEFLNVQCTEAGSILCVTIFDCIWHFQSQAIDICFTVGRLYTLLCKIPVTFFQSCQIQACGFSLIAYSYIWYGLVVRGIWSNWQYLSYFRKKKKKKKLPQTTIWRISYSGSLLISLRTQHAPSGCITSFEIIDKNIYHGQNRTQCFHTTYCYWLWPAKCNLFYPPDLVICIYNLECHLWDNFSLWDVWAG